MRAGDERQTPERPRLVLIADGFASGREAMTATEVQERTLALVHEGVEAVQLRDHEADETCFGEAALSFASRLRSIRPDLWLIVNTQITTARALGTSVHVGRRGPSLSEVRRAQATVRVSDASNEKPPLWTGRAREARMDLPRPIGYSAHSTDDARQAAAHVGYLFASPVFATTSHPEAAPLGLDGLRAVCEAVPDVPVYALGGITPERAADCLHAGAHGVAVLSALLDAPDPAITVSAFSEALAP